MFGKIYGPMLGGGGGGDLRMRINKVLRDIYKDLVIVAEAED